MITIRTATLVDIDSVAPLFDAYRQFYDQPSDLALARNFLETRLKNNESAILIAVTEINRAIGFCQLYPSFCSVAAQPIYSLYDLFVVATDRRSGAGKMLLRAAEALAAQNGKVRMDLTTARNNIAAQSLYESLGWVRDEVFFGYSKVVQSKRSRQLKQPLV
jgi:ribosomal protein S18 acetylase RimI-like enzyme